jgi:tRNA pseudouridine55 synthase
MHPTNSTGDFFSEGQVLFIDKPLEWTSFDVVRKIRNQVGIKKVGHAGTLDPLATGLLILCTGRSTKMINAYMAEEKEYTGTLTLGAVTPTFDLESEPVQFKPWEHISSDNLFAAAQHFTGKIEQVPPAHSAIKKDGKRLYELARKGIEVEIAPRPVFIHEFEILRRTGEQVEFRVVCSTGTYIRSLANDVGTFLGCGAYLSALRRTRIGSHRVDQAMDMDAAAAFIAEKRSQKG